VISIVRQERVRHHGDAARGGVSFGFNAVDNERPLGRQIIGFVTASTEKLDDHTRVAAVTESRVEPAYQRRGIATQLYEAAARYACEFGQPLSSDITISAAARGFWEKQERAGRAMRRKLDRGDEVFVLSCPASASLGALARAFS